MINYRCILLNLKQPLKKDIANKPIKETIDNKYSIQKKTEEGERVQRTDMIHRKQVTRW